MLTINPKFLPTMLHEELGNWESIVRRFLPAGLPKRGNVVVLRDALHGPSGESLEIHFKLYFFRKPNWKFWNRRSKAALEYRNYGIFQHLGISCARPVACGEQRDIWGRLRAAFIITETVPDSLTLEECMQKGDPKMTGAEWLAFRRGLILQLADAIRCIHQASFYHHDLAWRNVLVTPGQDGNFRISWIDCPRGRFISWKVLRDRGQKRDLAAFEKAAEVYCPRTDRLRAFMRYVGREKLDMRSKFLLRQVLEYRRTRWPDDSKS